VGLLALGAHAPGAALAQFRESRFFDRRVWRVVASFL
jgi:hypothetical protein